MDARVIYRNLGNFRSKDIFVIGVQLRKLNTQLFIHMRRLKNIMSIHRYHKSIIPSHAIAIGQQGS